MSGLLCLVRLHAKAIAGFLSAGLLSVAARFVMLGPEVEIGLTAAIVAVIVYLIPNTDC